MGLDEVLKLVGAIISVITVGKLIFDIAVSRKARLRDDYKFAKEFFEEISKTPKPHPLVVERGYQALAGDTTLTVKEVEYLLSLENPSTALRDYVLARDYIEHLPESGNLQVSFKKKYAAPWSRKWRRGFYLTAYFVCALLAISPMLFFGLFKSNIAVGIMTILVFFAAFGMPAYNFVKIYGRLYRGERLVLGQRKHSQMIIHSPINIKKA